MIYTSYQRFKQKETIDYIKQHKKKSLFCTKNQNKSPISSVVWVKTIL